MYWVSRQKRESQLATHFKASKILWGELPETVFGRGTEGGLNRHNVQTAQNMLHYIVMAKASPGHKLPNWAGKGNNGQIWGQMSLGF
jgi:hypothetical protein